MKKHDLEIQEPCSEEWGEMHGEETTRFCDKCTKNVHNISSMSRKDAHEFLANAGGSVCVVYQFDERSKDVRFADSPIHERSVPMGQLVGAKKLVAAAAVALPMLLAGCDTNPDSCAPKPDFRPIDMLMEQEQAFMDALSDLFEDDYDEPMLMGKIAEPVLMGEPAMVPEPDIQPIVMGDIAMPDIEPEVVEPIQPPPIEHEIRDNLDTDIDKDPIKPRLLMGKIAPTRL